MGLSEIMKSRRKILGISQKDLSEMSGISLATIKDIERGHGNPSLNTVNKIFDILGLEISFNVHKTV